MTLRKPCQCRVWASNRSGRSAQPEVGQLHREVDRVGRVELLAPRTAGPSAAPCTSGPAAGWRSARSGCGTRRCRSSGPSAPACPGGTAGSPASAAGGSSRRCHRGRGRGRRRAAACAGSGSRLLPAQATDPSGGRAAGQPQEPAAVDSDLLHARSPWRPAAAGQLCRCSWCSPGPPGPSRLSRDVERVDVGVGGGQPVGGAVEVGGPGAAVVEARRPRPGPPPGPARWCPAGRRGRSGSRRPGRSRPRWPRSARRWPWRPRPG